MINTQSVCNSYIPPKGFWDFLGWNSPAYRKIALALPAASGSKVLLPVANDIQITSLDGVESVDLFQRCTKMFWCSILLNRKYCRLTVRKCEYSFWWCFTITLQILKNGHLSLNLLLHILFELKKVNIRRWTERSETISNCFAVEKADVSNVQIKPLDGLDKESNVWGSESTFTSERALKRALVYIAVPKSSYLCWHGLVAPHMIRLWKVSPQKIWFQF